MAAAAVTCGSPPSTPLPVPASSTACSTRHAAAPGGWTLAHDVALVYLSLVHGADAHLAEAESEASMRHLRAWFPNISGDDLTCLAEETMRVYMSEERGAMVQTAVETVRQSLKKREHVGLLNDLAALAHADGVLHPGEVAFIQRFAAYLGVRIDA